MEGNSGTTNAVFHIRTSKRRVTKDMLISFTTVAGTATAVADFQPVSGSFFFEKKETIKSVAVPVVGDLLAEDDETFFLDITCNRFCVVADPRGQAIIRDNDTGPNSPGIGFGTDGPAVAEGAQASCTVSLTTEIGRPVSINFATADGSATAGEDFTAVNGALIFQPGGPTSQTINIPTLQDNLREGNETFFVNLTGPNNAFLGDAQCQVTISDDEQAGTLSISDATATEPDAGSVGMVFTVTLGTPSQAPVSVTVATSDQTANAGSDYQTVNQTVTFAPGDTSETVTVQILGDTLTEGTETFRVTLSNPVGAAIGDSEGIGTITDNEVAPVLQVADVQVNEGNAGLTVLTFNVCRVGNSQAQASVQAQTADNTAVAPGDYLPNTQTITFNQGETCKPFTVQVVGETVDEINETFFVNFTQANGLTINDAQAIGTIIDDDGAPTISVSDVTVNESAGTATVTVTLSAQSGTPVTVNCSTSNGSAQAGQDYTALINQVVTFSPGDTSETCQVQITNDALDEGTENFFVDLTNPSANATIADAQGTVTITDDDTPPNITIADISVAEDVAAGTVTLTVSLSAPAGQQVCVDFTTADGSAVAGQDYTTQVGTLCFAPGDTSESIVVPITDDSAFEGNETFLVNLTNAVNANIADGQAVVTITDDEVAVTISIADAPAVTEPNAGTATAVFVVTLNNASDTPITVDYTTSDGPAPNATAGIDYIPATGTLTFNPGETQKQILVFVNGDLADEPATENFTVTLSNPTGGATLADATAQGSINDNDLAPTITVSDVTENEGDAGQTAFTFTLTLNNASELPVSATVSTQDGPGPTPANAGTDYVALLNQPVAFAPGTTTQTVTVTVNGDTTDEPNETFSLVVAAPLNATCAPPADCTGLGTIVNDDADPVVSIADQTVLEGSSGGASVRNITVTLNRPSATNIVVECTLTDGTATAPADYAAAPVGCPITFLPGEVSKTFQISLVEDTTDEFDETINVTLNVQAGSQAVCGDCAAVVTILDDDAAPTVFIDGDETAAEGAPLTFDIRLSAASGKPVTVQFVTVDGTAVANLDYNPSNETVTFNPGQTLQQRTVTTNDDNVDESDEVFTAQLLNPSNATCGAGPNDCTAVGTITDNDAPPAVAIADIAQTEGSGGGLTPFIFTATLDRPSTQTVAVDYFTSDGTATDFLDYIGQVGTLTFSPGQTQRTITILVNPDFLIEPNETFFVNLSSPSPPGGLTIGDPQAQATILNDDP